MLFPVDVLATAFLDIAKVYIPPLNFHDSIDKLYYLIHTSLSNEIINPTNRLITEQNSKLVYFPNFDDLGLLNLFEIVNKIRGVSGCVAVSCGCE